MSTVTSADGTKIGYQITGSGPPLVMIDGAFCSRTFGPAEKLAPLLEKTHSVIAYDRRGRGESTNTAPYGVDREIEDLKAIAKAVGEPLFVYGTSSGAVLAARAVAAGLPTTKLAMHEPPLSLDGTHTPDPPDVQQQVAAALAANRPGDVVKLFFRSVGVPAIGVIFARIIPGVWKNLSAAAPTLPHDYAILGDTQSGGPLPDELVAVLRRIAVPTLLIVGGKSPPYMHHAAERVAKEITDAAVRVLPGQRHDVAAKAIAPLLLEHFTRASSGRDLETARANP